MSGQGWAEPLPFGDHFLRALRTTWGVASRHPDLVLLSLAVLAIVVWTWVVTLVSWWVAELVTFLGLLVIGAVGIVLTHR